VNPDYIIACVKIIKLSNDVDSFLYRQVVSLQGGVQQWIRRAGPGVQRGRLHLQVKLDPAQDGREQPAALPLRDATLHREGVPPEPVLDNLLLAHPQRCRALLQQRALAVQRGDRDQSVGSGHNRRHPDPAEREDQLQ
jgi:hypothetical protein